MVPYAPVHRHKAPNYCPGPLSRAQGCRSRQGYTRGKKRSELNKKLTLDDKQTQTIRTYSQKLKLKKKKKKKAKMLRKLPPSTKLSLLTFCWGHSWEK